MDYGTVEVFNNGGTVSRSKNLRGILTYARKHGMERVGVTEERDGGALVAFLFKNGARCLVMFRSYTVARGFVDARRSWAMTKEVQSPHWVIYTCPV